MYVWHYVCLGVDVCSRHCKVIICSFSIARVPCLEFPQHIDTQITLTFVESSAAANAIAATSSVACFAACMYVASHASEHEERRETGRGEGRGLWIEIWFEDRCKHKRRDGLRWLIGTEPTISACINKLKCTSFKTYITGRPPIQNYSQLHYGVATISRLLETIGLFCRLSSLLQGSFARETYNFKEPTHRSHPIYIYHTHILHMHTSIHKHARTCLDIICFALNRFFVSRSGTLFFQRPFPCVCVCVCVCVCTCLRAHARLPATLPQKFACVSFVCISVWFWARGVYSNERLPIL